jgi:hypothetical protein
VRMHAGNTDADGFRGGSVLVSAGSGTYHVTRTSATYAAAHSPSRTGRSCS